MDEVRDIFEIFEEFLTDDEEDIIQIVDEAPREPRVFRDRIETLHYWNDKEFIARFRLSKHSTENSIGLVGNQLTHIIHRNHALSPLTQVLVALRFYATGSFEIVVGDFVGVNKSTVCQILKKVSRAIARLVPTIIKFPDHGLNYLKREFLEIAIFRNVIGAIDCSDVPIQSPGGDNAENFRNPKGYFSIKVQTVCDANLKILDIVARWPGATRDRTIFAKSRLRRRLEYGHFGNGVLLGDSGYTLTQYLLIPLANPTTRAELLYQESQIRTRNVVERSYGVWKRRFPCLRYQLRLKLDTSIAVIVATAVLHNIAVENNDEEPDDPIIEEEQENAQPQRFFVEGNGAVVRQNLITNYFAALE